MRMAVFTFDDSLKTHFDVVRPILNKYDFKATFFVTGAVNLWSHIPDMYESHMDWDNVKTLNDEGFEIGNHGWGHKHIPNLNDVEIENEIKSLDCKLISLGIRQPVSFCYPGYYHTDAAVKVLINIGYQFARIGYSDLDWNLNPHRRDKTEYYFPGKSHRLMIYSTGIINDVYDYNYFVKDVCKTPVGAVPIFTTHGLRKENRKDTLIKAIEYLHYNNWKLVCMRDLLMKENQCSSVI